jgi:TolB-like protein
MIQEEKAVKAPPARNAMAVPYFQNKTGQADLNPLQKGIALMLTTDLSKLKEFQVLERARFQALVEELGLGVSGLVEMNTAPRVGRLLGAHWLVGGSIGKSKGEQIQIQSNPLDVTTQNILGQPLSEGDLSDLFRMEKELLFGIIKLLKIEVTPEEEKELRKPCSMNIKALMVLFKGIDASDRGNYEKAAQFYEIALQEDPNICEAGGALQQLQSLGLIAKKGRSRALLRSIKDQTSLTDQLTPEDATKRTLSPDRQPSRIPQ